MSPGLYVHVPFCRTRCAYCDFASGAVDAEDAFIDAYLRAMKREWHLRAREVSKASEGAESDLEPASSDPGFATVYVGGGTPSWIGPDRLAALCGWLAELAGPALAEFSVEANPDSFDSTTARALEAAGVTRVSLGAQSLDDRVLTALGRCHDVAAVARAVRTARDAGFADLSLDLMCGGPAETDASWRATVEGALELDPEHLSVYALTLEEGTRLAEAAARGDAHLADEDMVADRLDWAWGKLVAAGFGRYEIANWARSGHECRHNLNYWRYGPYLGLGAAAVSRLGGTRTTAPSAAKDYVDAMRLGSLESWEDEPLDDCLRARETVMLGLRLAEGVRGLDLERLAVACGAPDIGIRTSRWIEEGLLRADEDRVALTGVGMALANRVMEDLVVE